MDQSGNTTSVLLRPVLRELREHVVHLEVGSRLPTVRELMSQYRTSQITVQEAIEELRKEGLVETITRRGTFVVRNSSQHARVRNVVILRSDYPSRRGDEITAALHQTLVGQSFQSTVITYSDLGRMVGIIKNAPRADGYILQPSEPVIPVSLLAFIRQRSRVVVIEGTPVNSVDIDAVVGHDRKAVEMAISHLRDLGHRDIAYATGEPAFFQDVQIEHFQMVRNWSGHAQDPRLIITSDTKLGESCVSHMKNRMLSLIRAHGGLPYRAWILGSYGSAIGFLEALEEVGLKVPRDASMVVLDNPGIEDPRFCRLTMVGRTSQQIAKAVVARIEARLENPSIPYGVVIDLPVLSLQESTLPAAAYP